MATTNKQAQQKRRRRRKPNEFDFSVFFVVLTLVMFGIVMIFSASYYTTMTSEKFGYDMFYFMKRQSMWAIMGIAAMVVFMNIPYVVWKRLARLAYWLSNLFLAGLPFLGFSAGGQKRWYLIGPIQFQPSEFTKIAVTLYLALYICEHREELNTFKGFLKALVLLGIPVVLIAISNFSSALLVLLMGLTILFVGSPKIWYFVAGAALVVPLGALAILLPVFRYRLSRIMIWLDPWSDPTGDGFQTIQGLYAVASGGIFGLGLGQSRQKTFVPESHNDIIFAIICEELGLVGAVLVIGLFSFLIYRGIKIAMNAKDDFGMLVATGITAVIAFQAFINMAVVTNTIPNTGQPLPFISYGGTSLLFLMAMMGVLLNISRYQKE